MKTFNLKFLYEKIFPKLPVMVGSVGPSYFRKPFFIDSWKLISVMVTSPFSLIKVGSPSSFKPWKGIENSARTGYPFSANPIPEMRLITRALESSSVISFLDFEKIKSVVH